jgi:hypothetical protein
LKPQDQHHRHREEQICRKGCEKLHDRLNAVCQVRAQSDRHPDGNPDQGGHADQDQHPRGGRQTEKKYPPDLGEVDRLADEADDPYSRRGGESQQSDVKQPVELGPRPPLSQQPAPPSHAGERVVDDPVELEHSCLDQIEEAGALQHDKKPRPNIVFVGQRVGLELARPSKERAKQQLVVQQNDDEHDQHRVADRGKVALIDRGRDIGADAGEHDRLAGDGDCF